MKYKIKKYLVGNKITTNKPNTLSTETSAFKEDIVPKTIHEVFMQKLSNPKSIGATYFPKKDTYKVASPLPTTEIVSYKENIKNTLAAKQKVQFNKLDTGSKAEAKEFFKENNYYNPVLINTKDLDNKDKVKEVQRKLHALKYNLGNYSTKTKEGFIEDDGIIGSKTVAAIEAYNKNEEENAYHKATQTYVESLHPDIKKELKFNSEPMIAESTNMEGKNITSYKTPTDNKPTINKDSVLDSPEIPMYVKSIYEKQKSNPIKRGYFIINKSDAKMYLFDKSNNFIKAIPILLGRDKGDKINTLSNAEIGLEKNDPRLRGKLVTTQGEVILGERDFSNLYKKGFSPFLYKNVDSKGKVSYNYHGIGGHEVYSGELSTRTKALLSPEIEDNKISYGCVNIGEIDLFNKMYSKGDLGFISPEKYTPTLMEQVNFKNTKLRTGGIVNKSPTKSVWADNPFAVIYNQKKIPELNTYIIPESVQDNTKVSNSLFERNKIRSIQQLSVVDTPQINKPVDIDSVWADNPFAVIYNQQKIAENDKKRGERRDELWNQVSGAQEKIFKNTNHETEVKKDSLFTLKHINPNGKPGLRNNLKIQKDIVEQAAQKAFKYKIPIEDAFSVILRESHPEDLRGTRYNPVKIMHSWNSGGDNRLPRSYEQFSLKNNLVSKNEIYKDSGGITFYEPDDFSDTTRIKKYANYLENFKIKDNSVFEPFDKEMKFLSEHMGQKYNPNESEREKKLEVEKQALRQNPEFLKYTKKYYTDKIPTKEIGGVVQKKIPELNTYITPEPVQDNTKGSNSLFERNKVRSIQQLSVVDTPQINKPAEIDSVWAGKKFNPSDHLKEIFNIQDSILGPTTLESAIVPKETYTIKKGDTLTSISKKYNTNLDTLKNLNPKIKDINKIWEGQNIIVGKKNIPNTIIDYRTQSPFELDQLNDNLDNLGRIHLAESVVPSSKYYVIEDKINHIATVFQNGKAIEKINTATGLNAGDVLTTTKTDSEGKLIEKGGNMSTPAGMFRITGNNTHHGSPSFTRGKIMPSKTPIKDKNDKIIYNWDGTPKYDYEIASSIHTGYVPTDKAKCNVSNGCTRVSPEGAKKLAKYLKKDTRWYILPEDQKSGNFKITGTGLSFISNDIQKLYSEHAQGMRDMSIQIPEALINNSSVQSAAKTLENSKRIIIDRLNIPSDLYDKLSLLTLGIMGRESGYNNPGIRGTYGMLRDEVAARIFDKNVSAGPFQLRKSSIPKELLKKLTGKTSVDYNELVNSASSSKYALLSLYDIYKNIAPRYKEKYPDLSLEEIAIAYYTNPQGVISPDKSQLRISYAKEVLKNADNFKLNYDINNLQSGGILKFQEGKYIPSMWEGVLQAREYVKLRGNKYTNAGEKITASKPVSTVKSEIGYTKPDNTVASTLHNLGTDITEGLKTFGGSLIGNAIRDVAGRNTAQKVEDLTLGMVPYTRPEQYQANSYGKWENRLNSTADAATNQILGSGMQYGMQYGGQKIGNWLGTLPSKSEQAILNLSNPNKLRKLDNALIGEESTIDILTKSINSNYKKPIKKIQQKISQLDKLWNNGVHEPTLTIDQNVKKLNDISAELRAANRKLKILKTNKAQKIADRFNVPINFKNKLGSGSFGAAYTIKNNPELVFKMGRPLDFETPKTMTYLKQVGQELPEIRASFPISTTFFESKLGNRFGQVMPKMKGISGVPKEKIPQTAIDEVLGFIAKLEKKGVHADYRNPDNFLYNPTSKQFSIVDLNTTPPDGNWFKSVNNLSGSNSSITDILQYRFTGNLKKPIVTLLGPNTNNLDSFLSLLKTVK